MESKHYTTDRVEREKKIREIGQGKILASFRVKCIGKKYPQDWEIQSVTENGIILVYNAYTRKLVTKLIARRGQIVKLYNAVGKDAPRDTLRKASYHEMMGYNMI